MRVGIVACEAFEKEIDLLTRGDEDIIYKDYVAFGEHLYPNKMKLNIINKVNALEGKVDSVLLGYGICQSLKDVTRELRVPTVMLEVDDCIAAILTPKGYEDERKKCTGTWFAIPFFADRPIEKMVKELHLDNLKNPKYDAMWFIRKFFEGYSRCLYIDTGIGDREVYEKHSMEFASTLNLRHESREGTLRILKEGITRAKTLAVQRDSVSVL